MERKNVLTLVVVSFIAGVLVGYVLWGGNAPAESKPNDIYLDAAWFCLALAAVAYILKRRQ